MQTSPEVPFTFGSPAHDHVEAELKDAAMMGFGALQVSRITESTPVEIQQRFMAMEKRIGEEVLSEI